MHAVLAPAVAHPHGLLGFASITLPQSSINHTPPHMMLPMPTLLESIQCSLTVVCVLSTLSPCCTGQKGQKILKASSKITNALKKGLFREINPKLASAPLPSTQDAPHAWQLHATSPDDARSLLRVG